MGYAARNNPRSFAGRKPERDVLNARLDRFCDSFDSLAAFDGYCDMARLTPEERDYLRSRLPFRLRMVQA